MSDRLTVVGHCHGREAVGASLRAEGGFGLTAALDVHLPGVDRAAAEHLVQVVHEVYPYSNTTRGNVDVKLKVV